MKHDSKTQVRPTIRPFVAFNLHTVLACVLFLQGLTSATSLAALVFTENMGTPSGTTQIVDNTFENSGTLTFSGSGDVRNTGSSGGYAGASGAGNVFVTGAGTRDFVIGSISTAGYSSLSLSFGAWKSTTASDMSELSLSYSINGGSTYSALSILAQPTGSGTAVWRLVSGISLPSDAEGVSDLWLRWVNTSSAATLQFRVDDVTLAGTPIPEPSTFLAGALLALPFGLCGIRFLRNRKRA